MRCIIITTLRLVDSSYLVRNLDRVLHHGFGLLQTIQGLIEPAVLAVNFRHVNIGLGVVGISVRNDLVLFEGSIALAVVHQVLSQPANGVQIVAVQFNGVAVGGNGVLVLLLLFVGVAQRRIQLGGAFSVGNRVQRLNGASRIALFVVEIREGRDRFLGIRLQLHRRLELILSLLQIAIQPIEATE